MAQRYAMTYPGHASDTPCLGSALGLRKTLPGMQSAHAVDAIPACAQKRAKPTRLLWREQRGRVKMSRGWPAGFSGRLDYFSSPFRGRDFHAEMAVHAILARRIAESRVDKRSLRHVLEEWRKQGRPRCAFCRTPIGAAFGVSCGAQIFNHSTLIEPIAASSSRIGRPNLR